VAPGAGLIAIKVLDAEGRGNSADVLAGLQWVVDNKERYSIRVVNLSVGTPDTNGFDPLLSAVEYIWDMGIVVTVAAGNDGPDTSTVTSPGSSKKVITIGASDDDTVSEDASGERLLNFSGRGPTRNCIIKPDILAPGTEIISTRSKSLSETAYERLEKKFVGEDYLRLSGTSMSTPRVSGAIALLLERCPELGPDNVKYALKQSAENLYEEANRQGWGLLSIEGLISKGAENVREKNL